MTKPKFKISKNQAIIMASVGCVLLMGILIFAVIQHDASVERERAAAFEAEKSKKLAAIVEENKRIQEEAAKKEHEEHEKLQKLIDSGSLTTANVKSNCARLKNRETIVLYSQYSCTYKMRATGTAKMAVVFVSDNAAVDYGGDIARYTANQTSKDSLNYINEFFKREAARKNNPNLTIEQTFYGPFQQVSAINGNNANLADTQEIIDALQNTSLQNKVPESDYDLVHYVYLRKDTFRSFALPDQHRAFTTASNYRTTGTFIHETLHLFGASDKYNNGDCQTRGRGDPFNPNSPEKNLTDIMCQDYGDIATLNINTITAREIGWPN